MITSLALLLFVVVITSSLSSTDALSLQPLFKNVISVKDNSRRELLSWPISNAITVTASTLAVTIPTESKAAVANQNKQDANGLASRLALRDASVLRNSIFNVPPNVQVYPPFLRGKWDVSYQFGGFEFPSTKISRKDVVADFDVAGFRKCSIAAISDVGKTGTTRHIMKIDDVTGQEDRTTNLAARINAFLDYEAVAEVLYDGVKNPNRASVVFVERRTTNAERIELFSNARESEHIIFDREETTGDMKDELFVCSEHLRQVTFGTGSEVGVARQAVTNYAHFWSWRKKAGSPDRLTGNLLTAAYLDPQDNLFFKEPSKPVAVYSHILTADRIS